MDTTSSPFLLERHRRHVARDDKDMAVIGTLLTGGGVIHQSGRENTGIPGDIYIGDLGSPQTYDIHNSYRELRLHVDRSYFEARVGRVDRLAGLCLSKQAPLVAMFSDYMVSYVQRVPEMTSAEATLGLDGLLHLLSSLIKTAGAMSMLDKAEPSSAAMLALAQRYIDDHLFDPRLDAIMIKTALGISRTRLYEIFQEMGGVNAAIRDTRLNRVKAMLCDKADRRPIEQIARACGFQDYPSFFRAFRRRFGRSPKEVREEALEQQ
ncbi:helix-turn-helix domain-containing protein [Rhizobium oryzicola]|uniref:Helix-turn-helix domain-containing protein n=1 Tax=Rhizobium oryzicola TaxID=1232668 RepID=A0ABT8SWX5_9HYPH|nr:helix-turn-helix domain-containing protein [Rhizobium oryzicola]MDO1582925.1 helix-turn-helix domain-containing protein [Rhizobium oryzicola]